MIRRAGFFFSVYKRGGRSVDISAGKMYSIYKGVISDMATI